MFGQINVDLEIQGVKSANVGMNCARTAFLISSQAINYLLHSEKSCFLSWNLSFLVVKIFCVMIICDSKSL